jgi:hypothetical protein
MVVRGRCQCLPAPRSGRWLRGEACAGSSNKAALLEECAHGLRTTRPPARDCVVRVHSVGERMAVAMPFAPPARRAPSVSWPRLSGDGMTVTSGATNDPLRGVEASDPPIGLVGMDEGGGGPGADRHKRHGRGVTADRFRTGGSTVLGAGLRASAMLSVPSVPLPEAAQAVAGVDVVLGDDEDDGRFGAA